MPSKKIKEFLAVEGGQRALGESKFAVIPVPYERTVSYGGGTQAGPRAVIEASGQIELWDEETKAETWLEGIHTLPAINCKGKEETVFARIENYARQFLKNNKALPFYIGGEHSVSQALIKPYIEKYGKKLSILHFDAHADLREEYEGNPRSHASALYPASRRVKVVQTGIRSVGSEEKKYINKGNVKTFLMHENLDIKKLIPAVLNSLTDTVYITIDVDGFDPSVMPATGTPQPGGFTWYEALELFKKVILSKNIAAVDIVETAPVKKSALTEFNVDKLIYRMMGYLSLKK